MGGNSAKNKRGKDKLKRRRNPRDSASGKNPNKVLKKGVGVVKEEDMQSGVGPMAESSTKPMDGMLKILKDNFGFQKFKGKQESAIGAALQGRDCLVLMPTGGGKSLCYVLPSFVKPGLTLIISPLIALMQDQVNQLSKQGVQCDFVTSIRSAKERKEILKKMVALPPGLQLLFVAPELLLMDGFLGLVGSVHSAGYLSLVAIDESHCISSWGHDFRPAYRKLAIIKTNFPDTPVMALTATADKRVREDISASLKLVDPLVLVDSFNRPNIHYSVQYVDEELQDPLHCVRSAINGKRIEGRVPCCIVYVRKQDMADEMADYLSSVGIPCGSYHAGLSGEVRTTVLNEWQNGGIPVVAATVAFGMGIDKPDVRLVVHFNMPKSMASYYQESGRVGRDGKPSHSIIFYSTLEEGKVKRLLTMPPGLSRSKRAADRERGSAGKSSNEIAKELAEVAAKVGDSEPVKNEFTVDIQIEDDWDPDYGSKARERRVEAFDEVVQYCLSVSCRRKIILGCFGERMPKGMCRRSCDFCKNPKGLERAMDRARRIPEGSNDSDPGEDFGLPRHKWRETKEECSAREAAERAAQLSLGVDDIIAHMEAAENNSNPRSPGPSRIADRMKGILGMSAKSDVTCYKCGQEGHMSYDCQQRSMPGFMKASARACFKCGDTGHFAAQCDQSFGASGSFPDGGGGGGGSSLGFRTAAGKELETKPIVSGGRVVQRVSTGSAPFVRPRRIVEKRTVVRVAALPSQGDGGPNQRLQGCKDFLARAREASQARK
ncbi:hypothetical protein BSKO_13117 [Bryopsis sp. KO-2023]|nr:hypothetical protein BSKO_13117 [Bryopsis sp. KO-2023]